MGQQAGTSDTWPRPVFAAKRRVMSRAALNLFSAAPCGPILIDPLNGFGLHAVK